MNFGHYLLGTKVKDNMGRLGVIVLVYMGKTSSLDQYDKPCVTIKLDDGVAINLLLQSVEFVN